MEQTYIENSYVCLTFEEANILMENFRKQDLAGILARLDGLIKNTEDPRLRSETENLLRKLQNLTPEEYNLLAKDTEQGNILFPPNYVLPHIP